MVRLEIRFPTTPAATRFGKPVQADPCRCAAPFVRDGGCEFCGRWTRATIRATWRAQARRMARKHPLEDLGRDTPPDRNGSPRLAGVAL